MSAHARDPAVSWPRRIFALSWLSYFSYYFTRNFSVAKKDLQQEFGLDQAQLGWIDTAYLVSYCVGQFAHGLIGERLGPRRLIALGMLASAALSTLFGTQSLLGVLILLWGANGFVQATGWPGNGKLLASWFDTRRRGEIMGVWSTCYQAGGVVAKLVAIQMLVTVGLARGVHRPGAVGRGGRRGDLSAGARSTERGRARRIPSCRPARADIAPRTLELWPSSRRARDRRCCAPRASGSSARTTSA
jgi:sugar phosphate permease